MMLTPPEHEHSAAVDLAVEWMGMEPLERIRQPLLPHLQQMFGLDLPQALAAAAEAQRLHEGGAYAKASQ